MKRLAVLVLCIILLTGCAAKSQPPKIISTVETPLAVYSEMNDGTWLCEEHIYQYRLEISGRMPNAVKDSTFVYLSNLPEISFQRAYMAAGLSSNLKDYFTADEAVLVDWITE